MLDHRTQYHLERTREYSALLAKELDLNDSTIDQIYMVGPLHDIGKIGIRDDILLKPGKLTHEEYEEMKKHAIIGKRIIDKIIEDQNEGKGYLPMARQIAFYHHEKYDGSGYPKCLRGEDIPIAARIFALVDAYDAIVSKRPYKAPLPHEVAIERVTKDSSVHFDPEIVNVFLENNEAFKKINKLGKLRLCRSNYKAATSLSVILKYRIISFSLCCISSNIGSDMALCSEEL